MGNTEIFKKNNKAVILLRLFIPEGDIHGTGKVSIKGTGFIVSKDGKFVTNAHVLKEIPENEKQYLEAQIIDREENKVIYYKNLKVEVLKMDEENDIALMKLKGGDKSEFNCVEKIGDSEKVQEGDELVSLGYPLATELLNMGFGITLSVNHSIVSSIKRRQNNSSLHFFMIDTHVNNGSSGSPLFLKSTGEVVGIVSGRVSHKTALPDGKIVDVPGNIGICRPINYIKDLIK